MSGLPGSGNTDRPLGRQQPGDRSGALLRPMPSSKPLPPVEEKGFFGRISKKSGVHNQRGQDMDLKWTAAIGIVVLGAVWDGC